MDVLVNFFQDRRDKNIIYYVEKIPLFSLQNLSGETLYTYIIRGP